MAKNELNPDLKTHYPRIMGILTSYGKQFAVGFSNVMKIELREECFRSQIDNEDGIEAKEHKFLWYYVIGPSGIMSRSRAETVIEIWHVQAQQEEPSRIAKPVGVVRQTKPS